MFSKSFATLTGIAAGTAASFMMIGSAAEAASLTTLTATDIVNAGSCVGFTTCVVNDITVTASGAAVGITPTTPVMTQKTVGGVLGIGVQNVGTSDPSQGEIDYREFLTLSFAEGVIRELDLSFLYRPGIYADQVFEIAAATAGGVTGLLSITSSNTATWSLGGIVTNLSPSNTNAGGSYRIFNPFGDTKVGELILTAVQTTAANGTTPTSFRNSDFAFSRIVVDHTSVPEPGAAAALLGLAGAGLTIRRRRLSEAQES